MSGAQDTLPSQVPAEVPAEARMGLLDHISATSLDGDYAAAAARRGSPGGARPGRSPWTAVTLAAFAMLLVVAGLQTARSEPARQSSRESLVAQVTQARSRLQDTRAGVARLSAEVQAEQENNLQASAQGRALQARLSLLGAAAGTTAVRGPGMQVTVSDAPNPSGDREKVLDRDLQRLVNGLWVAGAEGIAINGQRLSTLSAVRTAGEAITVNFRSLRQPYVVDAVGDPDQLPARFIDTAGGAWWLNLKSVYRLRFDMNSKESLTLPGLRVPGLRFAHPAGGKP